MLIAAYLYMSQGKHLILAEPTPARCFNKLFEGGRQGRDGGQEGAQLPEGGVRGVEIVASWLVKHGNQLEVNHLGMPVVWNPPQMAAVLLVKPVSSKTRRTSMCMCVCAPFFVLGALGWLQREATREPPETNPTPDGARSRATSTSQELCRSLGLQRGDGCSFLADPRLSERLPSLVAQLLSEAGDSTCKIGGLGGWGGREEGVLGQCLLRPDTPRNAPKSHLDRKCKIAGETCF